jgi:hypothetical protein
MGYEGVGTFGVVIFSFLVLVAFFLIFRAVMLWYWKINLMVQKLDGILNELKRQNAAVKSPLISGPTPIQP